MNPVDQSGNALCTCQQDLIEKLMREESLARPVGRNPDFKHRGFHPPHGFAFGNAGIGHAIHVAFQ